MIMALCCFCGAGMLSAFAAEAGRWVIEPTAEGDTMTYSSDSYTGAATLIADYDFNEGGTFMFGLTTDNYNSNPYTSGLFFMSKTDVYTPWRPSGMGAPTGYKEGFSFAGRSLIKIEVSAQGDATLYGKRASDDSYVQLTDVLSGHFAEEVKGGYLALSFRNGPAAQYLYGLTVNSTSFDFTSNILESSALVLTTTAAANVSAGTFRYEAAPAQLPVQALAVRSVLYTPDAYGSAALSVDFGESCKGGYAQYQQFNGQVANVRYETANGTEVALKGITYVTGTAFAFYFTDTEYTAAIGDKVTFKAGFTLNDGTMGTEKIIERFEEDATWELTADGWAEYEEKEELHDGRLAIMPEIGSDTMTYFTEECSGAVTIVADYDFNQGGTFMLGLTTNKSDSNPYSSGLFFMTKTNVYTPWRSAGMGSPTAYANGFTMEGRVQIKVEIAANGDTVLYGKRAADEEYVQLTDLLAGHMKEETVKGYVAMSFRGGAAPQYLYSVKVYNGKGSLLSKYDFTEKLLESDELLLATNASKEVEAGNLVWEAPTAPVIPEPELLTGNLPSAVMVGTEVNLEPTVVNGSDDYTLTVTVTDLDGTGITPEGWLFSFEKTGIYTVRYDLIDADGAGIATAESVITVKLPSTQGSVAENFNQGAFDADVFEASETGVAVKDQALYFKTATGARFVTKGNSESFILTVDLVSVAGEGAFGFIFGMTGDYAYRLLLSSDAATLVGPDGSERAAALQTDLYALAAGGTTVTVRLEVFGGYANLYLRAANESAEALDTAVASFDGILLVGQVGLLAGENAEFTVDNLSFVSLTSVVDDNTDNRDYPDTPVNPDPDPDPDPDPEPQPGGCDCGGEIGAGILMLCVLALFGAAVLIKKKR